ncbi:Acyl-CoA N-acyltransferase [Penicillium canariense]|uniref:Acyl-CoA N-acyltransferase n=1 Tax=Penicillium canariense TaxID=189055 RepID=A0A9W9HWW5_9EURO|nr:Acyl-CoA N-acyltransferase [Penicillium canariense]KAJ5157665.1 Acyl-CoA N-acyltransferase [Penicillium canariense]
MNSKTKVNLVPWDPQSSTHRQCLVKQRDECGWDQDKVENVWKESQISGCKCIYWIGNETLRDTAESINGVPREPSQKEFLPVGHISLDSKNPGVEKVGLDSSSPGLFWVKTFFVSGAFQSKGVGRAAMDEVESIAAKQPLLATTLMLDVIPGEDQTREEFALATCGSIPKFTTEEWYLRRGYKPLKTVQNFYDVMDRNGKPWDMKTVFMKKDIL